MKGFSTFQLAASEDEHLTSHLTIHLEKTGGGGQAFPEQAALEGVFFDGLVKVNQDFREVSKLFDRSQVHVKMHENDTGPFAGRDIRIKNKYIAS